MRIIVTDDALIWNHKHPALKQYKENVLVICLHGEKVTDEYECFVSPYKSVGLGMERNSYRMLESVSDSLNALLGFHENIIFLTDSSQESLYPYCVLKDKRKFGHMHLCTMSPLRFEGKKRIDAHKQLLSDLSKLQTFFYIDSDRYLSQIESASYVDAIDYISNDYASYLPSIIEGVMHAYIPSYYDFTSNSYTPIKGDRKHSSDQIEKIIMSLREGTLGFIYPNDTLLGNYLKKDKYEIEAQPARIDGKKICKKLRLFRCRLAELNEIEFFSEECPYIGPCAGTCEKCDEEAAYLRDKLAEIPREKQVVPYFNLEEELQ